MFSTTELITKNLLSILFQASSMELIEFSSNGILLDRAPFLFRRWGGLWLSRFQLSRIKATFSLLTMDFTSENYSHRSCYHASTLKYSNILHCLIISHTSLSSAKPQGCSFAAKTSFVGDSLARNWVSVSLLCVRRWLQQLTICKHSHCINPSISLYTKPRTTELKFPWMTEVFNGPVRLPPRTSLVIPRIQDLNRTPLSHLLWVDLQMVYIHPMLQCGI